MWYIFCFVFFFFKQKTAYEMRISDWSSDVCSSDLLESEGAEHVRRAIADIRTAVPPNATLLPVIDALQKPVREEASAERIVLRTPHVSVGALLPDEGKLYLRRAHWGRGLIIRGACEERSDEHTSELQSLMRTS